MKFNKSAKESQLEISDEGIIEGYASVFNGVDSYGDTIAPKAFDHVITKGDLPTMLYGHDPMSVPIGKWTEMSVDDVGLKVKGQLNLNNAKAKEVFDAIKFGSLTGLSICFSCSEEGYEQKDPDDLCSGCLIKAIDRLYEISVVNLPADDNARISSYKSADFNDCNDIKGFEKCLRDAGFSRSKAKEIISVAKRVLNQCDAGRETHDHVDNDIDERIKSIFMKYRK